MQDDNLADLYSLEENPDLADIVVAAFSSQEVSTDQAEVLKAWAASGRGILIFQQALDFGWPAFSPNEFQFSHTHFGRYSHPSTHILSLGFPLLHNVNQLKLFNSCLGEASKPVQISRQTGDGQKLSASELREAYEHQGEEFFPLLAREFGNVDDAETSHFFFFASTMGRARIAWLSVPTQSPNDDDASSSGSVYERRCKPAADDSRLWLNVMKWLADR